MNMSHLPILLYHSIDTSCAPAYRRWTVTPERFTEQMRYLAENDYTPTTVSVLAFKLLAGLPLRPRTVAITFDDGLRDFALNAVPILEGFGFPATMYVVSGHIGATSTWLASSGEGGRPTLSWSEIAEMEQRGIEFGAHSHSHTQLDILPRGVAFQEIRRSKFTIEERLHHEVRSFAYPHGYASPATRRMVEDLGFWSACRVRHALSSPTENRYALSRIIMTDELKSEHLAMLLGGHTLPIAPATDRLAADGWRLARRLQRLVSAPDSGRRILS
jgi:peptidoglycan/xylan/chitin deacetylase (PgdA/CDA1 family)